MLAYVVPSVLLGVICLRSTEAKLVTVGAEDPSIVLDQYFWLDKVTQGCDTSYWTETPNSFATFNFTGTAVSIIGSKSARGGIYDVFIDSQRQASADRYAPVAKPNCGNVMFEKDGLTLGPHALRISLRANSTDMLPGSSGIMDFSAIQYTVPDDVSTTATGPTTRVTGVPAGEITGEVGVTSKPGKSSTGAIAGGVVGGVLGLALIGFLVWFLVFRKSKKGNQHGTTDLGYDGEKGVIATPYMPPPSNMGMPTSTPADLAYRSTSPPSTEYQSEPFQWNSDTTGKSGAAGFSIANSSVRPLPQAPAVMMQSGSVTYPPEKSPASTSPVSFTGAGGSSSMGIPSPVDPRVSTNQPLLQEDVQRIAEAVLAQASVTRSPTLPPAYR